MENEMNKNPITTGFDDLDDFLRECFATMISKGHDYREGHDDDLLHNFRTVEEDVEVDMMKIWYIYASKHWKAIKTFIKEGGQSESEPIEGRIKDQIVYLLLFYLMVQERKKSAWKRVAEIHKQAEVSDRNFRRLKKLHEANETAVLGADAERRLNEDPEFQKMLREMRKELKGTVPLPSDNTGRELSPTGKIEDTGDKGYDGGAGYEWPREEDHQ